ncbi:MAG: 30S ribosomal protein S12 methylthiotransferase RimO [Phycisphaerae bacterium]|nr:30S ribosomal protein S12 methylthiotransferase RimO [Phycisphaerae bacterium]MBM92203.1 30S ribosomal protein S12 methylthiotransferase RimO [Phycisphaerae bacterium]
MPTQTPTQSDAIETISFVSLGCPKNLVDSEKMLGLLAADGLMPVSAEIIEDQEHDDLSLAGSEQDSSATSGRVTPADAVVINTCGFLEASKQESLGVIKEAVQLKEQGKIKRVVVAGCLVQRHRAKMLDWAPGIDSMVGVFDREHIIEAVRGVKSDRETLEEVPKYWINANALTSADAKGLNTVGLTVSGKDGKGIGYYESDNARLRLTPRHYAYLRISEGCNQNCAFCTIPSIRGKMRSKPEDRIIEEARELMRDGAFEMLMIGQDTTSYGDDIGVGLGQVEGADKFRAGLPKLLRNLDKAVSEEIGRGWLRMMYAYPTYFSDEIIDAFAELADKGNLLPYLDIPLQHGSDRVLELMRRNVTSAHQTELCHKLRERIPGMAIRTTFITGFPGETDQDHQDLLDFIEEVQFDAVGCFQYSQEPGTVAGRMESDPALAVPKEIKQQRHDEIMEVQQQIAFAQAEFIAEQFDETKPTQTGAQFDVIIDKSTGNQVEATPGVSRGGTLYAGRTYFQAPQIDATTHVIARNPLAAGELVRCTIVAADGYDLIAVPVEELERKVSLPLA